MQSLFLAQDYYIAPLDIDRAGQLVREQHYSHSASKQASYLFGLFRATNHKLCGVSWWLPPAKGSVDKWNPGGFDCTLSLHRLVIMPDVETNGASFLLGRSIRAIRQAGRFNFLITYADTWQGHEGKIYQATNWQYRGLTEKHPVFQNVTGQTKSIKNGNGGSYNKDKMQAWGYCLVGYFAKHIYTMQWQKPAQPKDLYLKIRWSAKGQLTMFDERIAV